MQRCLDLSIYSELLGNNWHRRQQLVPWPVAPHSAEIETSVSHARDPIFDFRGKRRPQKRPFKGVASTTIQRRCPHDQLQIEREDSREPVRE